MKNKIIYIAHFFLLVSSYAQTKKDTNAVIYANTITSADLKEYLSVLASDEYEGRETGKKGQKMAAKYISTHFSEFGLNAIDDDQNYLQEFDLLQLTFNKAKINGGEVHKDFLFYGLENVNISNKKGIFVGFGIEEKDYNNYEGLNVEGKVVFFLEGEPINDGKSIITGSQEISKWGASSEEKIKLAKSKGASECVLISAQSETSFLTMGARLKHYYEKPGLVQLGKERNALFSISEVFASKLFKISPNKLKKIKSKLVNNPQVHAKIKVPNITIELNITEDTIQTENVVAMVEGTDKADEAIVISAHYDHIGIKNNTIYNGADDDGSGTVAVMELAQAFAEAKKNGFGPRRSIIFIGMTGEEKGLLGSEYYSNNPLFPLEKTVTNLNIDMIGRLDDDHPEDENYVYLIGTDMLSKELHNISEMANTTYKNIMLDYKYNSLEDPNKFYYRSDHYNFAKNGIPVIFYFNGVHEDYHKSTDTVDKILFNKVENITQLIFYTAWEIANREEKPKVD